MKKIMKILSTLLALTLICVIPRLYAFAQNIVADNYTYIGNPIYVSCGESDIIIVSRENIYIYSYDAELLHTYDISGAQKAIRSDGGFYFLKDGDVFSCDKSGSISPVYRNAVDFCLTDNALFVASEEAVSEIALSDGSVTLYKTEQSITSLATSNGNVYFAVKGDVFGYSNIYELKDSPEVVFDYCKNLEYLIDGDVLTYYGTGRAVVPATGNTTVFPGDESHVALRGDIFYYVTYSGELFTLRDGEANMMFGCIGKDDGHFAFPGSTYTDFGKLFVLDYANDRIAMLENEYEYIDVRRPSAITSDYSGNLYIKGKDGLFKYNMSTKDVSNLSCTLSSISQMAYSDGCVYLLSGGKVYSYADEAAEYICQAQKIRAEYFSGDMFIMNERGIYSMTDQVLIVNQQDMIDFDIAPDRSFYVIRDGMLENYSSKGELLYSTEVDDKATAVSISVVSNEFVSFGDIIITCTDKHKVYTVTPQKVASIPEPDLQYTDTNSILRLSTGDTYIYENPCSIKKICKVNTGSTLIVGKYDLYETNRMSYVLYEEFSGLKSGYIYKGFLSEPIEEKNPEYTKGTTLYENTAVYRFPSAQSEKLIESAGKNAEVAILPFCDYSYEGISWYKVRYNNKTGFIAKDMLTTNKIISGDERPQYNAKLNHSSSVYILSLSAGEYIDTGITLETGTDVEVIGIFDQNTQYTQIKYFDQKEGVQTGYILTKSLSSYMSTPLQTIGLICVGVVVLLLISVCAVRFVTKRKNRS